MKQERFYRTCIVCGLYFPAGRFDAKYCSGKCRMKAKRQRDSQEIKCYCRWCGSPFYAKRGGAMYCSQKHNQAAYRARKGAGKQAMF